MVLERPGAKQPAASRSQQLLAGRNLIMKHADTTTQPEGLSTAPGGHAGRGRGWVTEGAWPPGPRSAKDGAGRAPNARSSCPTKKCDPARPI